MMSRMLRAGLCLSAAVMTAALAACAAGPAGAPGQGATPTLVRTRRRLPDDARGRRSDPRGGLRGHLAIGRVHRSAG